MIENDSYVAKLLGVVHQGLDVRRLTVVADARAEDDAVRLYVEK